MVPNSPLARARAVIGGSLISAAIGLGVVTLLGSTPWVIGLAVGLAIFAMVVFDVLHAPAGALPLVIGLSHPEPVSFLATLAASTVLLVVLGRLYQGVAEPKVRVKPDA
jgi:CBS-domain-containing membrane protein